VAIGTSSLNMKQTKANFTLTKETVVEKTNSSFALDTKLQI
jgi:beta-glucosidase